MALPRLFDSRPVGTRWTLAIVPALLLGFICGMALGVNSVLYLVLIVVAILGGVLAGIEHRSLGQAALRGAAGGFSFGLGLLLGLWAFGGKATVAVPEPKWLQIVVSTLATIILAALGALIRRSLEQRQLDRPGPS